MANSSVFSQEMKFYYKNKLINKLIGPFENKRLFNPLQLSIYSLKDYGLWPEKPIALDAFCQMGMQWTRVFSNDALYLEMWDINPLSVDYAKKQFPQANVRCGDSIDAFKNKKFSRSDFNFILIDAPLPHQFPDQTFEHFGFFDDIFKSAGNRCVMVFNVVPDIRKMLSRHPHPSDFVALWKNARAGFYNVSDREVVTPDKMMTVYSERVKNLGLKVNYINYSARNAFFGFITMVVDR